MINVSRLLCGEGQDGDVLRYGRHGVAGGVHGAMSPPRTAAERRPVVVWNCTRTCNLRCVHCYTDSEARRYAGELSTDQAREMIADLGAFGVPVLLFSGGEPLVRPDLFELVAEAKELGIRPTLSTNGTLITGDQARRIREAGFTYVGISLDGIGEVNDCFRGKPGAFDDALRGFHNCVGEGQRVGLRMTLTRRNVLELHRIFDFIEEQGIQRACFYHLVYAGRGAQLSSEDLTHAMTGAALDVIFERTEDFHRRGLPKEILTVDNHVDGVYLYLRLCEREPARAAEVRRLLEWNGGGRWSSGVGIGDVDFTGEVHADQFWMHHSFGNVTERPFSEIWQDTSDPLMAGLKDKLPLLKGRCARCKWLSMCGGSLRVRADRVHGDPWAPDPGCYLSDDEIGLSGRDRKELRSLGQGFPMPAVLEAPLVPGEAPTTRRELPGGPSEASS